MIIRYLWGAGVGHRYAHTPSDGLSVVPEAATDVPVSSTMESDLHIANDMQYEDSDVDDPELGMDAGDSDAWNRDEDSDEEKLDSESSDEDMLVDMTAESMEYDFYE